MTTNEFFNLLEEARINKGLNITDFSTMLGLSHDTYYRWRKGEEPKIITACVSLINFCKEENLL